MRKYILISAFLLLVALLALVTWMRSAEASGPVCDRIQYDSTDLQQYHDPETGGYSIPYPSGYKTGCDAFLMHQGESVYIEYRFFTRGRGIYDLCISKYGWTVCNLNPHWNDDPVQLIPDSAGVGKISEVWLGFVSPAAMPTSAPDDLGFVATPQPVLTETARDVKPVYLLPLFYEK